MRMFRNDYSEGAAPEILEALVTTNAEQHVGYTEGDPYCERARELIRAACGRDDVDVEFCIGGTSAITKLKTAVPSISSAPKLWRIIF